MFWFTQSDRARSPLESPHGSVIFLAIVNAEKLEKATIFRDAADAEHVAENAGNALCAGNALYAGSAFGISRE